jgi:hypothetical protein
MMGLSSTSKLADSRRDRSLPSTVCLTVCLSGGSFQTNVPCKTTRHAVGEARSGRTSPSGSAPWGKPPGEPWGAFFLGHTLPPERLRTVQFDVRRISPSDGTGASMRALGERAEPRHHRDDRRRELRRDRRRPSCDEGTEDSDESSRICQAPREHRAALNLNSYEVSKERLPRFGRRPRRRRPKPGPVVPGFRQFACTPARARLAPPHRRANGYLRARVRPHRGDGGGRGLVTVGGQNESGWAPGARPAAASS